jgi:RNA polymerase sigma factor (sigma-70 family)
MHGVGATIDRRDRALEVADMVTRAAAGDQQAWNRLVDQFTGLLWSITSAYQLSHEDAADIIQMTWLKLLENLGGLREPAHVGAWLATTTRRECLRFLRRPDRVVLVADDTALWPDPDPALTPEGIALRTERDRLLWRAIAQLPVNCRRLLRVLVADGVSYEEVAAALDMPIGSIGPTRGRCLGRLRRTLGDVAQVLGEADEGGRSSWARCH